MPPNRMSINIHHIAIIAVIVSMKWHNPNAGYAMGKEMLCTFRIDPEGSQQKCHQK